MRTMKFSKAVYVTKHKIREDQHFVYQLYSKYNRDLQYAKSNNNIACQYNSRVDPICTCKIPRRTQKLRYLNGRTSLKCVYHSSRSYTDIGVGSVKAFQKKRVRKIYLPATSDRGCGSSNISSFISRKNKSPGSYYDNKKTSSKCVGGSIYRVGCVIGEKFPPITDRRSNTTNTSNITAQKQIEIGSNTIGTRLVTTGTQFENLFLKSDGVSVKTIEDNCIKVTNYKEVEINKTVLEATPAPDTLQLKNNSNEQNPKAEEKKSNAVSSDSLVQHVHNLDESSNEQQNKTYIDPMENKLEREYRRMFSKNKESFQSYQSKTTVEKPMPDIKSGSIVKRRFEALRRGITRKDETKCITPSSQESLQSRKDESISSDPPSLESRSFTDAKKYSPVQSYAQNSHSAIKPTDPTQSSMQNDNSSDSQRVKGMFKMWGKKFDFNEDATKANTKSNQNSKPLGIEIKSKPHKDKHAEGDKKNKKKFFFFKKKAKEKPELKSVPVPVEKEREREVYKPTGVTAGRCEIKDGLTLRIGQSQRKEPPPTTIPPDVTKGEELRRKTWLTKFLTEAIESKRSVNVRWNNSLYATSSSTVFELMDTIYKNTEVLLRSKSDITTDASYYTPDQSQKNKVNFQQKIQAWMITKIIRDKLKEKTIKINAINTNPKSSDPRWVIESSRAFANKIEVVLHSNIYNKSTNRVSSDYLRIDIPKDFFDVSSSDQNHTSDEEVYKIVEYESTINVASQKGLDALDNINLVVSLQENRNIEAKILTDIETVIKIPPLLRDVVIQGSNVMIPKRCDVVGVGIITQRDIRGIPKPILKIQDVSDESEEEKPIQSPPKKCEFAESYLHEYYKNTGETHLKFGSEISLSSLFNQGDGSKSCPNICDDFQSSAVISSCNTASCNDPYDERGRYTNKFSAKLLNKILKPSKARTETDISSSAKRVLPKDSLEVLKRRKIYAAGSKATWACDDEKSVSVARSESKEAQNRVCLECPKCPKMDRYIYNSNKNKHVAKHTRLREPIQVIPNQLFENTLRPMEEISTSIQVSPCESKEPQPPGEPVAQSVSEPRPTTSSSVHTNKSLKEPDKYIQRSSNGERIENDEQMIRPCSPRTGKVRSPYKPTPRPPCKPPCQRPCYNSCSPRRSCCEIKPCMPKPCCERSPCTPRPSSPKRCSPLPCSPKGFASSPPKLCSPSPYPPKRCSPRPCSPKRCSPRPCFLVPCLSKQCSPVACSPRPSCLINKGCRKSVSSCSTPRARSPPWSPNHSLCSKKKKGKCEEMVKKCPSLKNVCGCGNTNNKIAKLIKLNSCENLKIIRKKDKPCKEDREEGINIKVKDNDGHTLYERKDSYDHETRSNLLNEVMYKSSTIQRVSNPIVSTSNVSRDGTESKKLIDSDTSEDSLIEIQFKLRITQGDNSTEININDDNKESELRQKSSTITNVTKVPTGVFLVKKDDANESIEETDSKTKSKPDINIKIVVKSYKTLSVKNKDDIEPIKKPYEEFARKISQKFNTISTVDSDVDNVTLGDHKIYSMHRTTVDLNSSGKTNNTLSKDTQLTVDPENENLTVPNVDTSSKVVNSIAQIDKTESIRNQDDASNRTKCVDIENEKDLASSQDILNANTSECSTTKLSSKEEKKELFMKVMKQTHTKPKNKENVRELRQMLKIILTDSSEDEESAVRGELVKDVTYNSLDQDCYRNTDSMINYYRAGSSQTIEDPNEITHFLHPSEDENSVNSYNKPPPCQGCICNLLGKGLNCITQNTCCCKNEQVKKIDENVSCDLVSEDTDNIVELQNIETQVSSQIHKEIVVRKSTNSYIIQDKPKPIKIRKNKDREILEFQTVVSKYSNNYAIEYTTDPLIIHESFEHHLNDADLTRSNACDNFDSSSKYKAKPTIIKQISIDKHKSDVNYNIKNTSSYKTRAIESAINTIEKPVEIVAKECHVPISTTTITISEDDNIVALDNITTGHGSRKAASSKRTRVPFANEADILQCYATKKAVLEIYAEKTVSENREQFVAKLPKFVLDRERNIAKNFEKISAKSIKSVTKHLCKLCVKN